MNQEKYKLSPEEVKKAEGIMEPDQVKESFERNRGFIQRDGRRPESVYVKDKIYEAVRSLQAGSTEKYPIGNLSGEVVFFGDFNKETEFWIAESEKIKKSLEKGVFSVVRNTKSLPSRHSLADGRVIDDGTVSTIEIVSEGGEFLESIHVGYLTNKERSDEEIIEEFRATVPKRIEGENRVITGLKKEVDAFLERYNKAVEFQKNRKII